MFFSHEVMTDSLQSHGLQHARLPVLRYLPAVARTHVHCVGDAIEPSHPLSSPSPPALSLSQHHEGSLVAECKLLDAACGI